MKKDKGTLSTGVRCLQVLRLLSNLEEDIQLHEVAAATGLHPSTAHRILATLVSEGFVEQERDRRYHLSIEAFAVGAGFLRRSAIRRASVPVLTRLAEQTAASVNLAFWHNGKVVVVDCIPRPGFYHFYTETGTIVPAHATGIGKALLAFHNDGIIDTIGPLHRYTPNTITSIPSLLKEMQKIRKAGYSVDDEEAILGCQCIAAPILRGSKGPIAAISISTTRGLLDSERLPELVARVKEACLRVSLQVGYRPIEFSVENELGFRHRTT